MSQERPLRIGAIDVGTNSVHLVVADVTADNGIQVVEKQRRQVALGEGGLGGRELSEKAQERALEALREFRAICDAFEVDDVHCAATSAVREAINGVAFCKRVKAEVNIHVRIISGMDEARLIYLGARTHVDFSAGPALLVDLGGGSTELVLCDPETAMVRASLPVGHLRATEKFRREDPITKEEVQALRAWTRDALRPMRARLHPEDIASMVGTSGTMRCLARMATLARGERPTEHDHGLVLRPDELNKLIRRFQKLPKSRLTKIPGMDDRRRDTLPAGAVIVSEILAFSGVSELVTSAYSLRDGLVWDWIGRNQPELERSRREADPRRRSVLSVMDRYAVDDDHAQHVRTMALHLFDTTAELHRLRVDARRMLEFGALLHDVGHHISGEDHHRHGQYLIRHTRMSGFTAPELELLALIARYHRSKPIKERDLAGLDDAWGGRARLLTALVAVADGLDRGHDRNVYDLEVTIEDGVMHLRALTRGPPHLERWAVLRRSRRLAEALGVRVEVEVLPGEADLAS